MTARETGAVELKPCPFSGRIPTGPIEQGDGSWRVFGSGYWRQGPTREAAIAAWNARPQPAPSATGEIERWKAKLLAVATERDRLAEHREQLLEEREQQAATIAELDARLTEFCNAVAAFEKNHGKAPTKRLHDAMLRARATLERTRGQ